MALGYRHRGASALQSREGRRINLFLVTKGEKYHNTLSKISPGYSTTRVPTRSARTCERCFHGFTQEDILKKRKPEWQGINRPVMPIKMPKPIKAKPTLRTITNNSKLPILSMQTSVYLDSRAKNLQVL